MLWVVRLTQYFMRICYYVPILPIVVTACTLNRRGILLLLSYRQLHHLHLCVGQDVDDGRKLSKQNTSSEF